MMSIPILQIITKQWDKGQLSEEDIRRRASIPDRYTIMFPPAVYAFDRSCIIDCHGFTRLAGRMKYAKPSRSAIAIDKFEIDLNEGKLIYTGSDDSPQTLGSLRDQWIQCRYQWRYNIHEGGMIYWLYEEVILNAIIVEDINPDIFLISEPTIGYENLEPPP